MMTQIPWKLFEDYVKGDDVKHAGVGMMFLPKDSEKLKTAKTAIEAVCKKNDIEVRRRVRRCPGRGAGAECGGRGRCWDGGRCP